MQEQRVIYRQEAASQIDFPAIGKALNSLNLGTVDLKRLSQKHGDTEFLANLITNEVKDAKSQPDAVIFAGPKVMLDDGLSPETLKQLGDVKLPVFYMNYNLNPQVNPWRDAIGNAVKYLKGLEFTITPSPRPVFRLDRDHGPYCKIKVRENGRQQRCLAITHAGISLLLCSSRRSPAPVVAQKFGAAENLAPYIPTPQIIVERMLEAGHVKAGDMVYDLGSGDGRVVITAAQKFGARAVGVEILPDLCQKAVDRIKALGLRGSRPDGGRQRFARGPQSGRRGDDVPPHQFERASETQPGEGPAARRPRGFQRISRQRLEVVGSGPCEDRIHGPRHLRLRNRADEVSGRTAPGSGLPLPKVPQCRHPGSISGKICELSASVRSL